RHINGEDSPQSWGVLTLPAVVEPRRLIRIAWLRFQVHRPSRLAGDRIPRLDGAFATLRNQHVVEERWRGRDPEPGNQPVLAEGSHQRAGFRVKRCKAVLRGREQARRKPAVTGPVGQSSPRRAGRLVLPDLLSG